jgi:hypothetical protein
MTSAEVQEAFGMGCEIMNHAWAKGGTYYLSYLGRARQDTVITRSVNYFLDTLAVGIPGTDPLQIGFNYPGSDWNEVTRLKVAERHLYGSGCTPVITNQYEKAKATVGVDCGSKFWRHSGNMLGGHMDTIYVADQVHGGAAGADTSDRIIRSHSLIWPNSIFDHYRVPACFTHGTSPTSGDGTIQQLAEAKAGVEFAKRNNAATTFFFHEWDSVYAAPDPSVLWMSDFCSYLKEQQDSGNIKVVTLWDLTKDWVLRPVASDYNLFPNPTCTLTTWGGWADGWMRGGAYDGGTVIWSKESSDTAGFVLGDETHARVKTGGAGGELVFARPVPPDCWVTWSFKLNGYKSFTADSVDFEAIIEARRPETEDNCGYNNPSANLGTGGLPSIRAIVTGNQLCHPAGTNTFADDRTDGAYLSCRYLKESVDVWKEFYITRYIGDPCVVVCKLRQDVTQTAWVGGGVRVTDVCFSVKRRLGSQPVRY